MTDTEKTLVVDITHMKFRDFKVLLRISGEGKVITADDVEKLIDLLDRFVVGGIDDLDVANLQAIVEAVSAAIAAQNTTKN